jgi:hypothetical protein
VIQFHRYSSPNGDADRLAAIEARKIFWGQGDIKNLPNTLPRNFFMRQEVVCCLGLEMAHKLYGITPTDYAFYQGYTTGAKEVDFGWADGSALYQPRSSGFFSVIENIIAAGFCSWTRGRILIIDTSYQWWDYAEPFEELFPTAFQTISSPPKDARAVEFNGARDTIFYGHLSMVHDFYHYKKEMYQRVYRDLKNFYKERHSLQGVGVMYLRGGDKLDTETISLPIDLYKQDMKNLARRVTKRYALSDDWALSEQVAGDGVVNLTKKDAMGYFHKYGHKVSCKEIVKNYLTLVECHESLSCPSANLVNAAHWTKEQAPQQTYNPVYRYALI